MTALAAPGPVTGGGDPQFSPRQLARRLGASFPPTDEQERAITAPLGPCVLVAGAGSGKTQTMGLRVVWLVANGLVQPHRVLGLTFTRKAAAELGDRVRRMLRTLLYAHDRMDFLDADVAAALRAGEPTVTTYNSYAAGLVGEHALRIGREPETRLVGEAQSWQLAASVVDAYDGPMDAVDKVPATVTAWVLALAGELSEHLAVPAEVRLLSDDLRARLADLPPEHYKNGKPKSIPPELAGLLTSARAREQLLPIVDRYVAAKAAHGVIDYGDQVAIAARIARAHPEVADIERGRYGAVLLDEYQDTGEAQRILLTSLFRGHAVTAVGDPRQSIYGWRGASAGNLERFAQDFTGDEGEPCLSGGLTASFRNGERILEVANAVAAGIPIRGLDDRPLRPGAGREGVGTVECTVHESVATEAEWIADRVATLHAEGTSWGQIGVLARKRSQFPRVEAALRARGVPCEVVGLGGLLLEPEVIDVVSMLRVLADPLAGAALLRLLAGPRWRLGPRDLDVLGRRARELSRPPGDAAPAQTGSAEKPPESDVADDRSLLDALEDPGPASRYSAEGHRRLVEIRDEVRRLRRWATGPLPDVVTAVIAALGLDVELAARPGIRAGDALLSLDRLIEVAEDFAASGEDAGILAFLSYLDTAEDRERGLELEVAALEVDRVQLMTVHAAKGLEWDAVFVVGVASTVFPVENQPVADWARQPHVLPFPLRGDRSELPELDLRRVTSQSEAKAALVAFRDQCKARGLVEERRLAYVALTRARSYLSCSSAWWDDAQKPRGPSALHDEVAAVCRAGAGSLPVWAERPPDGTENPITSEERRFLWPYDPLGTRRGALEAAARLVRAVRTSDAPAVEPAAQGPLPLVGLPAGAASEAGTRERWARDVDLLLAELAGAGEADAPEVPLPAHLSVSQLVTLRRDPQELARQIRRPLPRPPAPQARRGTRFHLWLEQHWGQPGLLDVDELPGSADESAEPDESLRALQEAFQSSEWWTRVPAEVEFPFDMVIEGVLLRGRCDAVFTDAPDGLVDVVDWKTGKPPSGAEKDVVAIQLAVYRLAWHYLSGTPLDRIRAAFHYVGVNRTVRPADLFDEEQIRDLLRSVPGAKVRS